MLPEEALAYARWCGDGYDLPTVLEWRQALRAWSELPAEIEPLARPRSEPARDLLAWWLGQPAANLADRAGLVGGVVEWARAGEEFVGLGAPRAEFLPNLWDPSADTVRPLRPGERARAFGFRLIRRGGGG